MAGSMIEVQAVAKRFGSTTALAGVDLAAEQGRVLALLGPNGAGKTTLVRILRPCCGPTAAAGASPATTSSPTPDRCARDRARRPVRRGR